MKPLTGLTNRSSQPLAVVMTMFDFMKQFSMFAAPPARQRWLSSLSLGLMQGVEQIEVCPFSSREEYELMLDYFYKADDPFLRGMG